MKELSIEQKARRYDEAIEIAKSKIRNHVLYEDDIIEIFPELKESEDEKPNGAIVMEDFNEGNGFYKVNLAYLNKEQVEDIENIIKRWNVQKYNEEAIRDCIGVILTDASEQRFVDFNTSLKDCLTWLEKQGEQKPANKIEPKFKIEKGKWYVCIKDLLDNYANKAFRKGDIYLSTQDGSLIPSNSNVPYEVICFDTYFRDWNINDAKDGDVLYSLDSKQPFIFKHRKTHEQAEVYCGINIYGKFFVGNTKDCIITTDKYIPATKEQRDTLLKAMDDAGYTFDFENKKLKKK